MRSTICRKCGAVFSTDTKTRYRCYDCVPHREPNSIPENESSKQFYCKTCKKVSPACGFYWSKDGVHSSRCRICIKASALAGVRDKKQQMVFYKGGRCEICGYNKCTAALEFHHLDPRSKKFMLVNHRGPYDDVETELDKCVLLCGVCHAEVHGGITEMVSPLGIEPRLTD